VPAGGAGRGGGTSHCEPRFTWSRPYYELVLLAKIVRPRARPGHRRGTSLAAALDRLDVRGRPHHRRLRRFRARPPRTFRQRAPSPRTGFGTTGPARLSGKERDGPHEAATWTGGARAPRAEVSGRIEIIDQTPCGNGPAELVGDAACGKDYGAGRSPGSWNRTGVPPPFDLVGRASNLRKCWCGTARKTPGEQLSSLAAGHAERRQCGPGPEATANRDLRAHRGQRYGTCGCNALVAHGIGQLLLEYLRRACLFQHRQDRSVGEDPRQAEGARRAIPLHPLRRQPPSTPTSTTPRAHTRGARRTRCGRPSSWRTAAGTAHPRNRTRNPGRGDQGRGRRSLPVEIHFHSNNAMAPVNYLEGLAGRVPDVVHTASRPLAAGVSLTVDGEHGWPNLRLRRLRRGTSDEFSPGPRSRSICCGVARVRGGLPVGTARRVLAVPLPAPIAGAGMTGHVQGISCARPAGWRTASRRSSMRCVPGAHRARVSGDGDPVLPNWWARRRCSTWVSG